MNEISTLDRPSAKPPVPIDPRIRARRIEVQRDAGRRRLQRLADLGVVLIVAALFGGALWTPLLDVDVVDVTGTTQLSPALVREHAGVSVGDPLVRVHVGDVGRRIAEMPWVAEVRVDRRLDGVVALHVSERRPVATLAGPQGPVLLDADGRVLGPAAEATLEVPLVEVVGLGTLPAPGGYVPASASDALELAANLVHAVPGAMAALDVASLSGTLGLGGEVRFGDATQLDAKIRSLRTFLTQVDLTCLAELDLRLPANPVLTRVEGCP
ncbi:MAG: FtsQ-type POTRA domain-containing protein [Acidimicrobiales bacterium]